MAGGKGKGKKRPPQKRPASSPRPAAAKKVAGSPPPVQAGGAAGAGAGAAAERSGTTTAPPRPKPTRTERLEAARRARKRKALLTRLAIGGSVALVAAVIAAVVISDRRQADAERQRLTANSSCQFDTRNDPLTSSNHVPPARYEVDPPSGGDHDPSPVPAGIYGTDQNPTPSDAKLVHSLEHGFVVIWHRDDISEAERNEIRTVFENHSADVIIVPRPSLGERRVAATSWGKRLLCGEVEGDRLEEFVKLYVNESPEAGAR